MAEAARLAVMLSGSGRTLTNLAGVIARGLGVDGQGGPTARLGLVISSKTEDQCVGVTRGREALSDARVAAEEVDVDRALIVRPGVIPATELGAMLTQHRIDLIVLAGYLKMINVPAGFEGRIVNIHPSLLPKFGGKGMYGDRVHEAVLKSGEKETGCTVHLVNGEYDEGPIVVQRRCAVLPGDDVRRLASRVFEQECLAYPEGIAIVLKKLGFGARG
jgi:phosphoribosylglycinamide formyltransferase-1